MAISDFFMNNITVIRRAVQASFALFTLYGDRFRKGEI